MVRHGAGIRWLGLFAMSLAACSGADSSSPDESSPGGSGTDSVMGSGGASSTATSSTGGAPGTSAGGGSASGGASQAGGPAGTGGKPAGAAGSGAAGGAGTPFVGPDGGSGGKVGVWENVTPATVSLDQKTPGGGDNYGVQDVLADPVRPSDLYAFICYQGVWRSTDFGMTWKQVNAGADWGKPWGTAIDPNLAREPATAPALYAGVSNAIGFLKSLDFGVTWSITKLPASFGD